MSSDLDWVFVDIGGPIYSDQPYRLAVRTAFRAMGPRFTEDVGVEKPDPRIFANALEVASAGASRSAMVGDRLDCDVRPAPEAGMRTVWVLRGEAPAEPTPDQLAVPDAWVHLLAEVPAALEELA